MKKLLSLLRKDAILVRRNKIWTTFEVLIPVLLLVIPLFVLPEETFMMYKHQQQREKLLRKMNGETRTVNLTENMGKIYLEAGKCDEVPVVDVKVYTGHNDTRAIRNGIENMVKQKAKQCKPVGGVFVTSRGVEMIVPGTIYDIAGLRKSSESRTGSSKGSLYYSYIFYLYRAMNKKYYQMAKAAGLPSTEDLDVLKTLYIYDPIDDDSSLFSKLSTFIALSITLPVINTARTIVAEKATIQPYLNSIGLSRVLFYAEHFIFSIIKSTILVLATMVGYCIFYQRFHAFWLLIGVFFYILGSISLAILVSAFFSKPRRVVEGILVVWVGSLIFSWFIYTPTGWATIPASLNINQALKSYILAIEPHFVKDEHDKLSFAERRKLNDTEPLDSGMKFMDGFESGRDGYYACIVYLGIMIFDTILMAVGSIFISRIVDRASSFSVNKFWAKVRHVEREPKTSRSSESDMDGILLGEEVVEGRKSATSDIQLDNLVKIYPNGETAVNGLSMRAIRGQVSVLLGHNGCGKSTTFGMITGIFQPTAGTISIEGIDAVQNRREARQSIGYCPQYNPLYEKLTVMEHLRLVNTLKGGDPSSFEEDAEMLMFQIGLSEKRYTKAKNLSGGMKRKLCVCMAMIGGSRVVLLDEPTAGMDPGARLDVQKMLDKVKTERTILLTTHYMDEAEKLGDWVFVMSHGKMAASGSLHYLKKKYGDGYLMTLVLDSEDSVDEAIPIVEHICKAFIEKAVVKDQRGQMIEISLPENKKDKFLLLFQSFEAIIAKQYFSDTLRELPEQLLEKIKTLNIVAMGLSMSSLEQVFIKIEKECDRVVYGIDDEEKRAEAERNFTALAEAKKEPPLEGWSLKFLQYRTLLYKRFIHVIRNPDQLILQFILPLVAMYFLISKMRVNIVFDDSVVSTQLDLTHFPASKVILQFEGAVDMRVERYLSQYKHLEISYAPIKLTATQIAKNQTVSAEKSIGFVISMFKNRTVLHYLEKTPSDLPIAVNLLSNLKYLRISPSQSVGTIQFYAQFIPVEGEISNIVASFLPSVLFYAFTVLISFVIIPAIVFLVEENISKFQHQQLLSGLSPFIFWTGSILWDFLLYSVVAIYAIVLMVVFDIFTEFYYLIVPTFILFFFSFTAFVYLFSVFIKAPTVGSTILVFHRITTFAVGQGLFLLFMFLGDNMKKKLKNIRKMYLFGFIDSGYINMYALTKTFISQDKNKASMASVRKFMFGFESLFEFLAIWIDLAYLFLLGVLFFWLFVAFRSLTFKRILAGCGKAVPRPTKRYAVTEGTSTTNGEASMMVTSTNSNSVQQGKSVVVVNRLVKDFGKMRAVNGLSITVKQKECFGLLGQNGAGKTTTFDMLTGVTVPSGGSATVDGENITNRIQIGYCPQFDAMMGQFSGRQCLRIMTQLQGYKNCDEIVEMVLTCIGMTEHAEKLVQHCSGGQKRKLSVGIALISRSPCVMLDEPTAGIDPRARRDIWDILHCMREKANSSIVLTSHSMEECEALCTRIGVLREGDLIALGTSQELKSKYGNFFLLTMVLEDFNQTENLKKAISMKWNDAILKTEPTRASLNMVYQIPKNANDKWSETFVQVEALVSQFEIEDFMLTQATLEDAFLRLNAD